MTRHACATERHTCDEKGESVYIGGEYAHDIRHLCYSTQKMAFITHFLPLRPRATSDRLSPRMCAATRTLYDSMSEYTTIVADTGNISDIHKLQPHSATTNPTLVTKAALHPSSEHLLHEALSHAKDTRVSPSGRLAHVRNRLFAGLGAEIQRAIPGDVSTEVDARLSFDVEGMVAAGREIVDMYHQAGGDRSRVLIKLAGTWEGIRACEILEGMGIRTNVTLVFGKCQAIAAAQRGAFLISPFVGRIFDWHVAAHGRESVGVGRNDPGVKSVMGIYEAIKQGGFDTIVMGASFRSVDQVVALTGCDRLTVSPALIEKLKGEEGAVEHVLRDYGERQQVGRIDEGEFRWELNQDAMATEKLGHGIRSFAADLEKLDATLRPFLE